ncbi:MAG: molybdopterin-dependent oxidoreductase [Nitrospirota bacterium]
MRNLVIESLPLYNHAMQTLDRRTFLHVAAAGALSVIAPQKAESGNFIAKRFLAMSPRKTPFVTPNKDFYIVQCCGIKTVDAMNWSLPITGLVEKPLRLTYADLLKRPSIEKMVTLQCIDNEVTGELMSNAVWKGVSLASLLNDAHVLSSAQDIVFHGADDYSDSITLDRALHYDVFLAYQMNGAQLPKEHGFPLRAVVPGLYGIKNVKWITKIEVVGHDYKGYWQRKGWTDDATIKVKSRIDSPGHYNTIVAGQTFRGVAFAGYNKIRSVEISMDGGKRWMPTTLKPAAAPYTWTFWEYTWKNPQPGNFEVMTRAEDVIGRKQTDFIARPFPDGTSGLHSIIVFVE